MKKTIFMITLLVLMFAISTESASAIFLNGESWFGRPITRGSMTSTDDFGLNFAGQRSSNTLSSSSSNDFFNQMIAGQLAMDDSQSSQDSSLSRRNSGDVTGGFGDGTRLTKKVVYNRALRLPGRNNNAYETITVEEYGGEFANYALNNLNNQNARSSQSNRNTNTALNFNNQRSSGTNSLTQDASQDSISAAFGARATRGFSINLNRFF